MKLLFFLITFLLLSSSSDSDLNIFCSSYTALIDEGSECQTVVEFNCYQIEIETRCLNESSSSSVTDYGELNPTGPTYGASVPTNAQQSLMNNLPYDATKVVNLTEYSSAFAFHLLNTEITEDTFIEAIEIFVGKKGFITIGV